MRVFKYLLPIEDEVAVRLPANAKLLSVAGQGPNLCLWALVDPAELRTEKRIFRIAGTGHEITESGCKIFIGTAHTHEGALVWHVFECLDEWGRLITENQEPKAKS